MAGLFSAPAVTAQSGFDLQCGSLPRSTVVNKELKKNLPKIGEMILSDLGLAKVRGQRHASLARVAS
eukprot:4587826-Prymnesium_polylepis.2